MNSAARHSSSETYFFRDHGQFDLLRLRLLPELIEQHRSERILRLWSAGCASGEEVYSLAMLVDMLLPERAGWDIFILGSDIDPTLLEKARHGRYRQWSFRMMPAGLQQRYFRLRDDQWVLDERIRGMVTLHTGDLVSEAFPGGYLDKMDLILCRNVFIYFNADTVHVVAQKLTAALNEGGYLMTAHTELMGHRVGNLRSRLFAEGVVYQRIEPTPAEAIPTPPVVRLHDVPRSVPAVHQAASPQTPTPQTPIPQISAPQASEPGVQGLLATATDLANRGEYTHAEHVCHQILGVDPLAVEPHFLLAQLSQLKGDYKRAGELLDKALYLDPGSVAAHLELAAICERADKLPRARALRRAALDIIRTLPSDMIVEPYAITAKEMAEWLRQ